jgi:hypothetical protein
LLLLFSPPGLEARCPLEVFGDCASVNISPRYECFFEEVQRRKVYRVAAAYVIAAGFIIQISSAVFPAWELPNWPFRLAVVLLLIGFPIPLVLAWAYNVTPQGIRTTPVPATPGSHRRRNLIMLIATGLIISAVAGFFLLPRVSASKIDKSIAVLPFPTVDLPVMHVYQTRVIGLLNGKAPDINWAHSEIVFDQTLSVPPVSAEVQSAFDAARAAAFTQAQRLAAGWLVMETFQSTIILSASSTSNRPSSVIHQATYLVNANATYHKKPPCPWYYWWCNG